jgi:two-component system chemotaxis response regulator CheV
MLIKYMAAVSGQTGILLEAGTNEVEILEFLVSGQSFGVNVAKVKQLLCRDGVTIKRLDFASRGVVGTTLFRGKPILVVDFHTILKKPPIAGADNSRQLLLVTEFNQTMTGFLIDSANRIHRMSWAKLNPVDTVMSDIATYVTGVITLEDRITLVLDLERILAEINPRTAIQNIEPAHAALNNREQIILFADDSTMIRTATAAHLKKAGFDNLLLAKDGVDAFKQLQEIQAKAQREGKPVSHYLNLILTDIEMPEMDGLTLCKKIRQELKWTDIPILVYSSLINEQMIAKCKAVGATSAMSKPAIDQVIRNIESANVHAN